MITIFNEFRKFLKGKHDKKDRVKLKLPILYVYFPLLLIHYWKEISVFLLSNLPIEQRILMIRHISVHYGVWSHLWTLFTLLVLSVAISILFPLASWLLEYLLIKPNTKRIKLYENNRKAARETEEAEAQHLAKLAHENFKMEMNKVKEKEAQDYNEIIDKLKESYEKQISSLKEENDRLLESNTHYINEIKSFKININDIEKFKANTEEQIKIARKIEGANILLNESVKILKNIVGNIYIKNNRLYEYMRKILLNQSLQMPFSKQRMLEFITVINPYGIMEVYLLLSLIKYKGDKRLYSNLEFTKKDEIIDLLYDLDILAYNDDNKFVLTKFGNDAINYLKSNIEVIAKEI